MTLTVANGPSLAVAPKTLTFYYRPGDTVPAAQQVAVSSTGAALSYTASSQGGSWLTVTPAGGTTTSNLSVSVAPAGLAAGTYSGMLQISATNTSAAVPITLIVSSTTAGTDGVRLDPAPFTYDPTGTNGVSAIWVYGAGNNATANHDALQGLVLVKNGPSSTDAQAGVHVQGAAGLSLTELGFDIRTGQCTASGPHFAVVTSDGAAHVLPCSGGVQQAAPAAGWQRVRFDLNRAIPAIAVGQAVTSIDLVLSAGPDSNSGFAVVDNIDVNGKLITKP
ncbi:MAG: hypothetical protein ACE14L_12585 [Terriglobales bacterium]